MRKLLVILFICVFSQTIFASRVLIIRNLSNTSQSIFGLDMLFTSDYFARHATLMNAVTLEPGQFIIFGQYLNGDNNSFEFCPAPPTPTNDYKVNDYQTGNLVTDAFYWWAYDPSTLLALGHIKCQDVPQYPNNLRLITKGFKIGTLSSQGFPNTVDTVDLQNNVMPSNVSYTSFGAGPNDPMFYEEVIIH